MIYNYRTKEGVRAAMVVKEGTKLLHLIYIEDRGVVMRKVPKSEQRYMTPLMLKGKPYPLRRACNRFLHAGKTLGIKASVRRVVQEVKSNAL